MFFFLKNRQVRSLARDRVQDGRFLRFVGENNNESSNQIARSSDTIHSTPRSQRNRSLFLIPLVTVRTQHGDRGLCLFCSSLEHDVLSHFTTHHAGCGIRYPEGCCGEIRGILT
jgi:hypothetical protein